MPALIPKAHSVRLALLKLRSAVDGNAGACDPSRGIGSQKGYNIGHIFRLTDALECLHSQSEIPARLALGEVGHIGFDYTWSNGVDANSTHAQMCGPMLDQCLQSALGRRI